MQVMKKPLTLQITIRFLFSLALALWTTYLVCAVVLKMPPWFVLVPACFAVAAVAAGFVIGIRILHKMANDGEK